MKNINMVQIADPDYPEKLVEILGDLTPKNIYYIGDISIINKSNFIAFVGSRNMSDYGREVTQKLTYDTITYGYGIVSGGALGVDITAHKIALNQKAPNIVVLAGGLNEFYPSRNSKIFEEIIDSGGVVISEYEPEMPSLARNFLERNRLIAALSEAVVVTEATWRSGALSTAAHANDYDIPVGAVPGSINSPTSAGCNKIIRDMRAELISDFSEVLCLTNGISKRLKIEDEKSALFDFECTKLIDRMSIFEQDVYTAIKRHRYRDVETIMRFSNQPIEIVMTCLGKFELDGIIKNNGRSMYKQL
ncbi:MAG: DNA-processing protein DprA [Bifidobacteriaceae bacterium]|jgi:DNA processing protein|nr:DNA-processing protein DprA [Bifidobacteriaceae bacterium]